MAPKRRNASDFGVNYSPKRTRAEPAADSVRVEVSTVWIRQPVGRLLTLQLKDSDAGDAFRHLIRDCKAIAPALTDRRTRSSVMNGWKIAFGNHSSDYVHTLQIPTVPEEVCGLATKRERRGEERTDRRDENRREEQRREEKRGEAKRREKLESERHRERGTERERERETRVVSRESDIERQREITERY